MPGKARKLEWNLRSINMYSRNKVLRSILRVRKIQLMEMGSIQKLRKNSSRNRDRENLKNIKMTKKYNFLLRRFKRFGMRLITKAKFSRNKYRK